MTAAEITAIVRALPETTAIPLTLTRSTVSATSFLTWPNRRDELPVLRMIEHAVEAGR
jgi:hypothetical protein